MISGNRMPRKGELEQQKRIIHTLQNSSPQDLGNNPPSQGFQMIKPKQINRNKVDGSLLQKNTQLSQKQSMSQQPVIKQRDIINKAPTFQSSARHGIKIGGLVLGREKWQCKVCKQVNQINDSNCLRCESIKGEIKEGSPPPPGIKKQQNAIGTQRKPAVGVIKKI